MISLNSSPILGLESCEELELTQRLNNIKPVKHSYKTPAEFLKQFSDVFAEIGHS